MTYDIDQTAKRIEDQKRRIKSLNESSDKTKKKYLALQKKIESSKIYNLKID